MSVGAREKDHPSENILASPCASHLCCTQVLYPVYVQPCGAHVSTQLPRSFCSRLFIELGASLPLSFRACITRSRDGNAPAPKTLRCSASRDCTLRRKFKAKCEFNARVTNTWKDCTRARSVQSKILGTIVLFPSHTIRKIFLGNTNRHKIDKRIL